MIIWCCTSGFLLFPPMNQIKAESKSSDEPLYQAISIGELTHTVANTGSTARDHLANERTFLAWLRTSVSLLSISLAIAKFAPGGFGLFFGVCFALLGSAFLTYSGVRYFEIMRSLERGEFKINTGAISALLLMSGLIAFFIVLAIVLQAVGEAKL